MGALFFDEAFLVFVQIFFFQQADHPVFGKVAYPTAPYRLSATPVRVNSPAPALGADDAELGATP